MKLTELLAGIVPVALTADVEISGLALDSREVKPGDLFFAYPGTHVDGRKFITQALEKGARIVLAEGEEALAFPIIAVPQLAQKIGLIAARFYQYPSKKMAVIGITGTNGKTSCSHFIAAALKEWHQSCGVIGTLGSGLYGDIHPGNLTTPDTITLQKTLADFATKGAKYTAMEVSSHSIDQHRIDGIDFFASIFTNLTRDHLDYHGTMENYGNAKKKLFTSEATQYSVINADDAFGKVIIDELSAEKVFSYGTEKNKMTKNAVIASDIRLDLSGIRAHIASPWGEGELSANIIGKFNVSNLLAVFTSLCLLDIPYQKVLHAISTLKSVDGRMQTLGGKGKPLVAVDYSHTPDSLEQALMALRHHCQGKLYCVFGCGGDRDRGKRSMMAKIAEQHADYVVVTDDNPRTENSEQIFKDISAGFLQPEKIVFEHDRAAAIRQAIQAAQAGDCILIAGKGAETYQIIGEERYPFSDVEQVILSL